MGKILPIVKNASLSFNEVTLKLECDWKTKFYEKDEIKVKLKILDEPNIFLKRDDLLSNEVVLFDQIEASDLSPLTIENKLNDISICSNNKDFLARNVFFEIIFMNGESNQVKRTCMIRVKQDMLIPIEKKSTNEEI